MTKGSRSTDEPSSATEASPFVLTPECYAQLKEIARIRLRNQPPGATLNCTALVHEAYLKLNANSLIRREGQAAPQGSNHFFAVASMAMRQILVDHARGKLAEKRGGGALHVTLQDTRMGKDERVIDLLALDEALAQLGRRAPGLEQLVMLKFFAGLKMHQVADVLGRSQRSVERDWARARMYLFRVLETEAD